MIQLGKYKEFQFQYGASEGGERINISVGFTDFNSSMVRVKVRPIFMLFSAVLFQFQYGASEG